MLVHVGESGQAWATSTWSSTVSSTCRFLLDLVALQPAMTLSQLAQQLPTFVLRTLVEIDPVQLSRILIDDFVSDLRRNSCKIFSDNLQ